MDYSTKEDIIEYFFDRIKYFTLPSESNNYKSRLLESNMLLYCVVLLLALKIITIFISINIPQNIFFADITKISLENFVNRTRQSLGLQPLVENSKLNQAAQLKAQNMVLNNYFAHTSPTGITPWYWFLQSGYNYKYAGENLAIGFFDSEEVYNAWLNSPSHEANIINPNYKEVGTAVMGGFGSNNTIVVVQEFGTAQRAPLPVKTTVAKNNGPKPSPSINATPSQPETAPIPKISKPVVENNITPTTNITPSASSEQAEKVLSQSTESQISIENTNTGAPNIYSKVMNSVVYNYEGLLQDVIYGVSLVVIGILIALIFFNLNFDFRKELVFRSVVVIVLLSLATVLDKSFIASIIPHQIII